MGSDAPCEEDRSFLAYGPGMVKCPLCLGKGKVRNYEAIGILEAIPKSKVGEIIKEWLHTPTLLLRAGEMSAQEIRTVKAVLKAVLRGIEG